MTTHTVPARQVELQRLLELTERVGRDPLLTQASTGNSSAKLNDVLWIKASGRWMADAMRDDILIPLDLPELLRECLGHNVDPAERYPRASLETAMHAALPHRVVLHVHCVNTITWAVRRDALVQLACRLRGMRWCWVPYTPSGLPLSRAMERALRERPDTDLFILGNHGLVLGGDSPRQVEDLLQEVEQRLSVPMRNAPPADYPMLTEICEDSSWRLPEDDGVHALATDAISKAILAGGLLYPCQAIFSDAGASGLFRPIQYPDRSPHWQHRPFLIVDGRGVVINRSASPAEEAMLRGLAQVVQRLSPSAPIRYLTKAELAGISGEVSQRYRELASNSTRA